MKKRHSIIASIPVLLLVIFASCKKTAPNIFDMFNVKLTFNQSAPFAVDENGEFELTSKDSVIVDYTIESPDADMYMICLYKTGGNAPIQKIPITDGGKRRVYSGTFKFYAKDLGAGISSYRIWPLDQAGVYLGDGYKTVNINVLSDLKYWSNIKAFAADTVEKVTPSFLSLGDAKTYNYNEASAKSGSIDFAFYHKFIKVGNTTTEQVHMYSLTANPNPYVPYDVSSWTKRGTLFSAPQTSNVSAAFWKTRFNTGPKIEAEAKAVTINLTSTTTPILDADKPSFVFFKTPEGKYGVIYFISRNFDYLGRRYVWLSYKMPDY